MLISFRNCIQFLFSSTEQSMGFIECSNNTLWLWISVFLLEWNMFRRLQLPSFPILTMFCKRKYYFNLQCWTSCYAPATYNLRACNRKKTTKKTFRYSKFCSFFVATAHVELQKCISLWHGVNEIKERHNVNVCLWVTGDAYIDIVKRK